MSMNKAGVLYTMMLSLLSVALLSVAILFIQHSASVDSRHIELSFAQKIIDLDTSIQNTFREAIRIRNTTHATATVNSFTVYERLPTNFNTLDDNILANLRTSINSDVSLVNVSTHMYNETHGVILQPLGIEYRHESDNRITISPNFAITGYNVTLTTTGAISACSTGTTPGALTFEVYGLGASANCTVASAGALAGTLSFKVSENPVTVTLNASGQLIVESNTTIRSIITTYHSGMSGEPYIEVPISVLITDPSFNFVKQSYVRVW